VASTSMAGIVLGGVRMSKQKSLVIVQNVPTQFDIPLYNQIVRDKEFDLKVIYTQEVIRDAETGCLPQWDHVKSHNYSHHFLTHKERKLSVLLDMVLSASPDHVVVSGYWPKLHRDLARGLHKRNISMGLRSDNTIEHTRLSGPRGWLKKRYLSRLLPLYNYWHPVGQQAAEYLRFVSGAAKPVELFPYNVDNEWFRTQAKAARTKRSAILQKMSLPKDSMTLLGIMKWSDREDPMTLVKAYKLLLRTYPKLNLILVGDGPLRKEVNQELKGIKGVHLPGYVPYSKLPELYAVSDLFIHPAPGEPWGVSIQESLACGGCR